MAPQTRENSTGFTIGLTRWLALAATALCMGFTMPSCPGQQEMKQQVDALQANQSDITRKLQMMDGQTRALSNEVAQQKQVMDQMADAIQKQMTAMNQLNLSLQQLNQQVAAMYKGRKNMRTPTTGNRRRGR